MTSTGNPEEYTDATTRHIHEILQTLGAAGLVEQSAAEVTQEADAKQNEQSPFASFLFDHPELANADPAQTDIFWDLDETMFKRTSGKYGQTSSTHLTGSWRPDMPQILTEMRRRGFNSMHILSSANIPYISAALEIFRQQFGQDPAAYFGRIATTRSYGQYGDKIGACFDEADRSHSQGRRAVFIDDSHIPFEQTGGADHLGYMRVDRDLRYDGDPDLQFTVPLPEE